MAPYDPRVALRGRDLGLRRISRLTWRAGLAGLASSALLTLAFGHHAETSASPSARHSRDFGAIEIPAQPPAPAGGGGQVTSGAS